MKQAQTIGKAATRALPPTIFAGVGLVAFGAIDVFRRGSPPVVMAVICLGLAAVVFLTYFILGIAGYRVSADGSVRGTVALCLGRRPRGRSGRRRPRLHRASDRP